MANPEHLAKLQKGVDEWNTRSSCEAGDLDDTLPPPAHHFPGFERAASGAIYGRARGAQ